MQINKSQIGPGHPTYIVAELSCNHNQNFELAKKLVIAAKESGADAIKLQTYRPDTITLKCDNEYFQIKNGTLWDGSTLYDLYSKAFTPWEWHLPLKTLASDLGLDFFSSPFDITAVDFLEELNVPCYKVASFEVNDHILLKKIAQTKKPVILSTGTSELSEIADAVSILKENGTTQLCILKCTSEYPAPIEKANLKTIKNMAQTFNCVAGLSDHTLGIEVPIAAVCLGANFIEKHFTLDKLSGSPDDAFSLEPAEFKQMVSSIRIVEKALGSIDYCKHLNPQKNIIFRRSLFAVRDISKGEVFSENNVKSVRPGYGLHTKYYPQVLGKKASKNIEFGTPLSWSHIDNEKLKILFLGGHNPLVDYLKNNGDEIRTYEDKLTLEFVSEYDFIISYGYRHIIKKEIIERFPNRIINLHISLLPWNRGADPNLWSILDNTLKGVTIHYIDEGLDTGDIICQKEIHIDYKNDTLSSSYQRLQEEIQGLFKENWSKIRNGTCGKNKQDPSFGSCHKIKDRPNLHEILPNSWDTKICDIVK